MELEAVRTHFDAEALQYDRSILKLVPHYHEQHEVILQLVPFDRQRPLRILDLGCGTGVLSQLLARAFPSATLVSVDLSPNMVDACRRNLAAYGGRATQRVADFGRDDIGSGHDLVVSGLAIHHLDDAGKRALYGRIHRALDPGGMFINRELVRGATPALSARYEEWWRQFVRANGVTDDAWFRKYVDEDRPASVEDQLAWLGGAGFRDVGCHWRYFCFAIFGGMKS